MTDTPAPTDEYIDDLQQRMARAMARIAELETERNALERNEKVLAESLNKAVAERDAQEARIAELKDTCARLRTTMVDRKLYEAAANHIEVLEAKIQELQALGDS